MYNPIKRFKTPTVSAKEIVKAFDLSLDKGPLIFRYVSQLLHDYPNDPAGILKEIPLNIKGNERYLASFTLGNFYAPIVKEMKEEEMTEFLATIADDIDIGTDRIDTVLTYLIGDVIVKMKVEPIPKVIKNIISTKFSDKEKDYLLFVFGIMSR